MPTLSQSVEIDNKYIHKHDNGLQWEPPKRNQQCDFLGKMMEWKLEKDSVELRPEKRASCDKCQEKSIPGKRKLLCVVELQKEDQCCWNTGSWRKQRLRSLPQ